MRWSGGRRTRAGVLAGSIAAALGVLLVLLAGPAAAQPDPAAVVGSYTVVSFDPAETTSGPDVATCWGTFAVGDTVTITQSGATGLQLTLPAGWAWLFEPAPDSPDPADQSNWGEAGPDDAWQAGSLDFTGGLIYVSLEYGLYDPTAYCQANIVAESPNVTTPPTTEAPPTTDTPQSSLGVTIFCQYDFVDTGRVECTASPVNQAPDAVLEYDWSFDGITQIGLTGSQLSLIDVPAGEHTAVVAARDLTSGLASAPDSVTFATTAAPPSSDGGGLPPLVPVLIAGGVLTAGAAVAGARALARRGRRPVPAGGPYPPGSPPGLGPPADPLGPAPGFPPGPLGPPAGFPPGPLGEPSAPFPPSPFGGPSTPPPPSAPPGSVPAPRRPARPPEPVRTGTSTPGAPPGLGPAAARPGPAATPVATPSGPAAGAGPVPLVVPGPPGRPPDRRTEEVWLEADPERITVRGDGRIETGVAVWATKSVNGVPQDASAEVRTEVHPSDPDKFRIITKPSFLGFWFRGVHAGSTPAQETVTVTGTSADGRPVRSVRVHITIEPVKLEVRLRVWKEGFREKPAVFTLPQMAVKVRGTVTHRESPGDPRVAHAHWEASLWHGGERIGPVQNMTDERGDFWVGLPERLVRLYGADTDYRLPSPIDMGLNDEVRQSLHYYRVALEDLRKDLARPANSAYTSALADCEQYPAQFLEELRRREETHYNKLLGALQLLRASILFVHRYRHDFIDQRAMVEMAVKDLFERVVNALLDFLPVADKLFDWVGGQPLAIGGKALPNLRDLLTRLLDRLGGRVTAWFVFLIPLQIVVAAAVATAPLIANLLEALDDWAVRAGFKPWRRPADMSLAAAPWRPTTAPPAPADRAPWRPTRAPQSEFERRVEEALAPLSEGARKLAELARDGLWLVLNFLAVAVVSLLKIVAAVVSGALGTAGHGGARNAIGEALEEHIGDVAKKLYEDVGGWVATRLGAGGLDVGRDLGGIVLNQFRPLADFDRTAAGTLQRAYRNSADLTLSDKWRSRIATAVDQENENRNWWRECYTKGENQPGVIHFLEDFESVVKLVCQVIQALCFSAVSLRRCLMPVLKRARAAGLLGPLSTEVELAAGADSYGAYMERAGDVVGVLNRLLILGFEAVHLEAVEPLLPERIDGLYR